jgi:hypothetical protein
VPAWSAGGIVPTDKLVYSTGHAAPGGFPGAPFRAWPVLPFAAVKGRKARSGRFVMPSKLDGFENDVVIVSRRCIGQLLTPLDRVGDHVVAEAVASIAQSRSGPWGASGGRHL